jgi:hypothetical protein
MPPNTVSDLHADLRRRALLANRLASERLLKLQATLAAAKRTQEKLDKTREKPPRARVLELHTLVESLRNQLASQPVIEQAKGIIMANTHCDEDQAFDILRRASQRTNVKLREVARQIVLKSSLPDDQVSARRPAS